MSALEAKYKISTDQYGLAIIEVTGRCTEQDTTSMLANVCHRYEMVPISGTSGAILKALDGVRPTLVTVTPPTLGGKSYQCVKVDATVNPFAPKQVGGTWNGRYILQYYVKYQQVGGVS